MRKQLCGCIFLLLSLLTESACESASSRYNKFFATKSRSHTKVSTIWSEKRRFSTRKFTTRFLAEGTSGGDVDSKAFNYAVLALVPVIWGTYTPITKALYSIEKPPPPLLFNVLSYSVSFSVLALACALFPHNAKHFDDSVGGSHCESHCDEAPDLSLSGGLELGLWLFLGSNAQVLLCVLDYFKLPHDDKFMFVYVFEGVGHSIYFCNQSIHLGSAYYSICSNI